MRQLWCDRDQFTNLWLRWAPPSALNATLARLLGCKWPSLIKRDLSRRFHLHNLYNFSFKVDNLSLCGKYSYFSPFEMQMMEVISPRWSLSKVLFLACGSISFLLYLSSGWWYTLAKWWLYIGQVMIVDQLMQ